MNFHLLLKTWNVRRLAVSALLFAVTFNVVAAGIEKPHGIRDYQIGRAPDFTLNDLEGDTRKLSDFQGRWIFLHFWASWCGPCRLEMPHIQKLTQQFDADELAIILVNTAEDEDTVFSFLAEMQIENSLLDSDGLISEAWKPRGLPTTFLIDPQGQVQYQAIGGREWSKPVYLQFLRRLIDAK